MSTTNGRFADDSPILPDISPGEMLDIIETFETTTTPLCDLADDYGTTYERLRHAIGRPTPTGENNRDRIEVPPDETVLKAKTGDIYHLPAIDRDGSVCNNGGTDPNYKEKPLSVLPGYELCNRCAGMVLARTEAITPTEVIEEY